MVDQGFAFDMESPERMVEYDEPRGLGFIKDITNSLVGTNQIDEGNGQSGGPIFSAKVSSQAVFKSETTCIYAVWSSNLPLDQFVWQRPQPFVQNSLVNVATLLLEAYA